MLTCNSTTVLHLTLEAQPEPASCRVRDSTPDFGKIKDLNHTQHPLSPWDSYQCTYYSLLKWGTSLRAGRIIQIIKYWSSKVFKCKYCKILFTIITIFSPVTMSRVESEDLDYEGNVTYWSNRWTEDKTGWHKSVVHPDLVDNLSRITGGSPNRRFFIPLCVPLGHLNICHGR
ncbi:unnamed protein product [Allacma fusca]|uniref:Uncharacterized protein n=1 Tax=Allacma fusca TaxID=39272 RepID=A0A8J2JM57_9HEXA|nr:unnamed protein product [Allacma fusca]